MLTDQIIVLHDLLGYNPPNNFVVFIVRSRTNLRIVVIFLPYDDYNLRGRSVAPDNLSIFEKIQVAMENRKVEYDHLWTKRRVKNLNPIIG